MLKYVSNVKAIQSEIKFKKNDLDTYTVQNGVSLSQYLFFRRLWTFASTVAFQHNWDQNVSNINKVMWIELQRTFWLQSLDIFEKTHVPLPLAMMSLYMLWTANNDTKPTYILSEINSLVTSIWYAITKSLKINVECIKVKKTHK